MAIAVQPYPRVSNPDHKEVGLLDIGMLKALPHKINPEKMPALISKAIDYAALKTKQEAVDLSPNMSQEDMQKAYIAAGKDLFKYFKRPDPVFMSQHLLGKTCQEIAKEFFYKRNTHLISMNAGWRYQYLLVECSQVSGRFKSVSDLNTGDSDVNMIIETSADSAISIYISMKNRKDTISGGSGAAVLKKLENMARIDKNRTGAYCCVIALGMQTQKYRGKTKHSPNIEFWPSNFLWPFVSGYTYSEIVKFTSEALEGVSALPELPNEIIEAFKRQCIKHSLLDAQGIFNNRDAIIKLFCNA